MRWSARRMLLTGPRKHASTLGRWHRPGLLVGFAIHLGSGCFSPDEVPCEPGTMECRCAAGTVCEEGLTCKGGVCRPTEASGSSDNEGTSAISATSGNDEPTSISSPNPTSSPLDSDDEATVTPLDSSSMSLESTSVESTSAESTSAVDPTSTSDPGSSSADTDTGPCNNGILEPGEMCDRGSGCTECVLDEFACNPLNDAGCSRGTKCTYLENGTFGCVLAPNSPAALGMPCPDLYQSNVCQSGLACVSGATCNDFCCTEWCDINGNYRDCSRGVCFGWWVDPSGAPGLEWLGSCDER